LGGRLIAVNAVELEIRPFPEKEGNFVIEVFEEDALLI
jgi:hypothetical protein